ncbi:hypothetical protein ABIA39_009053 [Nocardia sp. GAS34]|uniref:hypothetical protein n=1 Tax=unclassified Nocardia TaxID=2637762 RepID=UPI003D1B1EC1
MMGAPIWWMVGGVIAIVFGVIGMFVWQDLRESRDELPGAVPAPAAQRPPVRRRPERAALEPTPRLDHSAYEHAPSVSRAHAITQTHIDCAARDCARKRQALGILAAAGKIALRAQPHFRLAGAPVDPIPVVKRTS